MNSKQQEIYKGLNTIGDEIASFYADGVEILNSDLKTKSYLIAHLSREIEGGLRDIFTSQIKRETSTCALCKQQIKKRISHRQAIIETLGITEENELSTKWHQVAQKFHRFAHRHGAWKKTRGENEFKELWYQFEEVLSFFLGNYYAIEERLNRIVKIEEPTSALLGTLSNLLEHQARNVYFFTKIESQKWLEPLFNEGYFSADKNPGSVEAKDNEAHLSIPFWPALEYLKKISSENLKNPNKENTEILIKIIDDIVCFRKPDGSRIINEQTDYSMLELIGSLPADKITEKHFEFIKSALIITHFDISIVASGIGKILIERFIKEENKEMLLKTMDIVFLYTSDDKGFQVQPLMTEYFFKETLDIYKNDIIELIPLNVYELAHRKIKEISKKNKHSFNPFTNIPTIEDHPQTMYSERYENQLVYFTRDVLLKIPEQNIYEIVNELLKGDRTCIRLGLYTINQRYEQLSELFWRWKDNPLTDCESYKHELFELLNKHAEDFSDKILTTIIKWIEGNKYEVADRHKEEKEKIIAYRKKEWLYALLPTQNPKIEHQYNKYHQICSKEIYDPGYYGFHKEIKRRKPQTTKEKILSQTLLENIMLFKSFRKEKHDIFGPTIDDLGKTLVQSIKEKPDNFLKNCENLVKAPAIFQYYWILGLFENMKSGQSFSIEPVLKTSFKIIKQPTFMDKNNSVNGKEENGFIETLISLIIDGIKDNVSSDISKMIKDILLYLFEKDQSEVYDYGDYENTFINSSIGKTYYALFQYILTVPKSISKAEYKKMFQSKLDSNKTDILFFYVVGMFFRRIFFIDKKWIETNLRMIFPESNSKNARASYIGYFTYNGRSNKECFTMLKENKIYELAFEIDFTRENTAQRNFVNHLCSALTHNYISLNDKIIDKILIFENKELFNHLQSYFYHIEDHSPERQKQIEPLWNKIFKKYNKCDNEEVKEHFLGSTSLWVKNVFDLTDDLVTILIDSTKYVKERHRFIKGLHIHMEKSTDEVAKILIELFKYKVFHDISRDLIKEMVAELYNNKLKEKADRICDLHANKEVHFLRDLYKKNNSM